ncbi:MAG: MarR family transcriptional regulator [Candidatus Cloacimonetes bacterium]|nr:MarR family transcriptional regulator [Candidatus Cloacimonadota bacterium]
MIDSTYEMDILKSLRKIIRAIDLNSKKLSKDYKITIPQLLCLLEIGDQTSVSASFIAKQISLSPSTLVGVLDRLEAKKFIVRTRSESDRRSQLLSLTEEGKSFVKTAPSPLQENFCKALSELSPLEQSSIFLSLQKIVELMEAEKIEASPILETGEITLNP